MRIKALLALLGLGLALLFIAGCNDDDNEEVRTRTLSGTITNTAGAPVEGATVTLLLNGTPVTAQTTTTNALGQFTLTNVPEGSGFTIRVSSSAVPPAFQTNTISVPTSGNQTALNVTVIPPATTGATVSGSIGTTSPNDTFTVTAFQNGTSVATATATLSGTTPVFTLTNVPTDVSTVITVDNGNGVITVYGPITVPSTGVADILVLTKTATELAEDGVQGTIPPTNGSVTVAAYATNATISVDGGTVVGPGNPVSIPGVSAGTHTITVNGTNVNTQTVTLNLLADRVYVFRPIPTA